MPCLRKPECFTSTPGILDALIFNLNYFLLTLFFRKKHSPLLARASIILHISEANSYSSTYIDEQDMMKNRTIDLYRRVMLIFSL